VNSLRTSFPPPWRACWTVIREAVTLIERAAAMRRPGPYQVEAAIAACHAEASSFESTDWMQVVALYDLLLQMEPSPVVRLNRALAIWRVAGAQAALCELDRLAAELDGYHIYHAARGELLAQMGHDERPRSSAAWGYAMSAIAVPPPQPRAPPVRGMRPERLDRGAGPRRRPGHLRQLLPDARRRLLRVRQVPGMQLRRQRPPGLPVMLAAGHRPLRPLRPGPPAAGPLARRPGLRPVLDRCAAAPGTVRIARAATPADRPARPGRRHLRQLRRAAHHLRMHRLRPGRQAL